MTTSVLIPEGNLHPVLSNEDSSKAGTLTTANMGDEQGSFSSRDDFDGDLQNNSDSLDNDEDDVAADPVAKEEFEADINQQQQEQQEQEELSNLSEGYDIVDPNSVMEAGNGHSGEKSIEASATNSTDFSASELNSDDPLLVSADLPEDPAHMDKAAVRKSLSKGKSELSKSRQKNHALKHVEQGGGGNEPAAETANPNPGSKAQAGGRKIAASAHVPSSGANKQSLDCPRSHDDINAIKESAPRQRLSSSRVLGDDDSKDDGNTNSTSGPRRGVPKRTRSTGMKRAASARGLPGRVKSFDGTLSKEDLLKRGSSSRGLPGRVNSFDGARGKENLLKRSASVRGPQTQSKEDILLESQPPAPLTSQSQESGDMSWDPTTEGSGFPVDKKNNNNSVEFDIFPERMASGDAEAEESWAPFPGDQEGFPADAEKSFSRRSTTSSSGRGDGKNHESSELLEAFPDTFAPTDPADPATSVNQVDSSSSLHASLGHVEKNQVSPKAQEEEVALWTCWACEYGSNAIDHVFCGMCGTGRDWVCPACDHENKSSFNFCGMCGGRKGNVIVHKDQPVEFDMRVRMAKKPLGVLRKPSSSDSRSKRGGPSSGSSVVSGKSMGRRRRPSMNCKPKLASDEMSNETDGAKSRSEESGDDGKHNEKRPGRDRGRGRDSMKKSQGRTRPSERLGEDGKERKLRGSMVNGDGRKERQSEKKERKSRNPEKVRRSRDSASVPPAERKDFVRDGAFARFAPEQPELKRTNSLSDMAPGEEKKSNDSSPNIFDGCEDHDPKKKTAPLPHNNKESASHGVLATPSIKKRLLKMGGKVGGKLFNTNDLPMMQMDDDNDDAKEPVRSAEITISKNSTSSDNNHDLKKADVPPTPSLKKRLLGKMNWGKSEHGKPSSAALPMMAAPMIDDSMIGETNNDVDFGNEKEPEREEEDEDADFDPLEGLSHGFVVTAKDLRPNRPVTAPRRKPPNRNRSDGGDPRNRRSSHHGGPVERPDRPERPGGKNRMPKRTMSTSGVPTRKLRPESSNMSRGDRKGGRRPNQDQDPQDLSEAESIESNT